MKNLALFILASALVSGAFAQSSTRPPQSQPTDKEVAVQSEVKDLARGYALAFSQLSRPPLTLVFQREGQQRVLEDVKAVRAAEGVLVVEVGRGLIYVINAKDVLYLTDGGKLVNK
ncbi:MAG: hypothetical protein QM715_11090 [Nibricoccus sp.]